MAEATYRLARSEKMWIDYVSDQFADDQSMFDMLATDVGLKFVSDIKKKYNLSVAEEVVDPKTGKPKGAGKAREILSTPELEDHLKNRQLVDKNGKLYSNSNEFYANDVKVRNTNKIYDASGNEVKGIIEVEYSMPELDKTGKPTGNYNNKTFTKTIYDPDIISDTEYVNKGIEAANSALADEPYGVLPRTWTGTDSEGVQWTGNSEGGVITSMWPTN